MAAGEDVGEGVGKEDPGGGPDTEPVDRYEPGSSGRDPHANARPPPAWVDDERARPLGMVITAALLFVLLAAAVLFGGRGSFGPGGRPSLSGPGGKALGDILYSMNEDVSCPVSSFDSATGSVAGRPLGRCSSRDGGEASHPHQ
jgi:hypothetical protein